MAGPACVIPKQCVELFNLFQANQLEQAMARQKQLWRINEVFAQYALAACIKAALNIQGFAVGDPISPQQPLGTDAVNALHQVLAEIQ